MADDPLESDIERSVSAYARKRGVPNHKFTAPGRRGVPDRIFWGPGGRVFLIEFKRHGKKPTPRQWNEIKRIRETGTPVYVVDTKADGKIIVELELADALDR